jgi:hypothetical protein
VSAADTERPPERDITLTSEAWLHIWQRHPELIACRDDILLVTTAHEVATRDRRYPNRWRLYRSGVGPSRWLAVVVDFTVDPARIVTAYGFRKERPR